jgi:hypothetical protein
VSGPLLVAGVAVTVGVAGLLAAIRWVADPRAWQALADRDERDPEQVDPAASPETR